MIEDFKNPFVQSVMETFKRMLNCDVRSGEPKITDASEDDDDLIGIIGLTGTVQGTVALKLPVKTAVASISNLSGISFAEVNRSVVDGVGELVNIIAGNAKVKMKNHNISISLPTVLQGGLHRLTATSCESIKVPFECRHGHFEIIVCIRPVTSEKEESRRESTHCR